MDADTNVNSEMSDLVHHAEEWANAAGFNRIPEKLAVVQKIHQKIITRSALMVLAQLGIKSEEDFKKYLGYTNNVQQEMVDKIETQRDENAPMSPISPMPLEEFQNILKNGWNLDQPLPPSPLGTRRRTSLLANLIPMSPIQSELSHASTSGAGNKPQISLKTPGAKKSMAPPAKRPLMTSTPIPNNQRGYSVMESSFNRSLSNLNTSQNTTRMHKLTPCPMNGEGPLENRASRLRRLKIEESMRKNGGREPRMRRTPSKHSITSISFETLDLSMAD